MGWEVSGFRTVTTIGFITPYIEDGIDVYLVGNNREILPKLPKDSVDLIYVDPPYNAKYSFEDQGEYLSGIRTRLMEFKRVMRPTGLFLYHFDHECSLKIRDLVRVWLDSVFDSHHLQAEMVWQKIAIPNRCALVAASSMDTIVAYSQGPSFAFRPERIPLDREIKPVSKPIWKRQKPLKLMRTLIEATSQRGAMVLDPFAGSGTTLIAAQQLGRRFIGIDNQVKAKRIWRQRIKRVREFEKCESWKLTPWRSRGT